MKPWTATIAIGTADLEMIYDEWDDREDIDPDLSSEGGNNDGYCQVGECFSYAAYLNGQVAQEGVNNQNHGFIEDLLSLHGISGSIIDNQTIAGNFLIGKNLSVTEGVKLTIDDYSKFFLNDSVSFNIDEGSEVEINDNVEFWGFGETSAINVLGDVSFGGNFSLDAPEEVQWAGLTFQNVTGDYSITGAEINNCTLSGNCNSLTVNGCNFNNALLEIAYGDLTVNNYSSFNNSRIYAGHPNNSNSSIFIDHCSFDNDEFSSPALIAVDDYSSYRIFECTIDDNAYGPSISLNNAGGLRYDQIADDNTIKNCILRSTSSARDECPSSGVQVFTSYNTLKNNYIYDYDHGVRFLNSSQIKLPGNEDSETESETQRIKNNAKVQIFSTENSFPTEFSFNSISGTQNAWYLYTTNFSCSTAIYDINDNFWGGLNCEDIEEYLFPDGCYDCSDVWEPEWAKKDFDIVKSLYDSTQILIDSGFYSTAESQLKMIIQDYPDSKYASAAVKDLYYIKEIHDLDYFGLQNYYDTAQNLQDNDRLDKLSKFFANLCDVKLANYQNAIDWYDAIIQDPLSFEDSVFAIIDKDYVIMLMLEDSLRNGILIPDYLDRPKNYDEFKTKRRQLLKLLGPSPFQFLGIDYPPTSEFNHGKYYYSGNHPSPFRDETIFSIHLEEKAHVNIEIYNQLGMMVSEVIDDHLERGDHTIHYKNHNLSPGIYISKCTLNNKSQPGHKLVVY